MKNFKDGFNDFKKGGNDYGARPKFGFAGGAGRKGGHGGGFDKSRTGGRSSGQVQELFSATCSACQKSCEVPFRPNGEKPVYCSACFGKMRDDNDRGGDRNDNYHSDRREKPAFSKSDRPAYQANNNFDAVREERNKDLEAIRLHLAKIELQLNRVLGFVNPPAEKVSKEQVAFTPIEAEAVVEVVAKKVRKPKTEKVAKAPVAKKAAKKVAKKAVKKAAKK
jgi:CxxC-x17-CxxC domain-containing protein